MEKIKKCILLLAMFYLSTAHAQKTSSQNIASFLQQQDIIFGAQSCIENCTMQYVTCQSNCNKTDCPCLVNCASEAFVCGNNCDVPPGDSSSNPAKFTFSPSPDLPASNFCKANPDGSIEFTKKGIIVGHLTCLHYANPGTNGGAVTHGLMLDGQPIGNFLSQTIFPQTSNNSQQYAATFHAHFAVKKGSILQGVATGPVGYKITSASPSIRGINGLPATLSLTFYKKK